MYTGRKYQRGMYSTLSVFMLVTLVIGIVFTCVSGGLIVSRVAQSRRCKVETTAVVIENQPRYGGEGDIHFYPVYRYYANGREYVVTSSVGSYPAEYEIGDEVELRYNWDNPGEYYAPADTTWYILVVIFGAMGIGMLGAFIAFTVIKFVGVI